MNHEKYQQLISQFIDRELQSEREQELFDHLAGCKECRQFLRTAWQIQVDIQSMKPTKNLSLPKDQTRFAPDRPPVSKANQQSVTRSPVSTLILFMVVTLIIGFLFSMSIEGQRSTSQRADEIVQIR